MLSSQIYQAVFNSSPIGEYLLTPTTEAIILAVNDSFLKKVSRTREDLVGLSLFDAFPEDSDDVEETGVATLRKSLARVIETGNPDTLALQRYPVRITTSDGASQYEERIWTAVSTPIFNDSGELVCVAHSTVDVTDVIAQKDQPQANGNKLSPLDPSMVSSLRVVPEVNQVVENAGIQAQQRIEHARNQAIFDNMTEGFVLVDRDWTVVQMNEAGLRICHRTAEQAIGRNHWEVWPETVDSEGGRLYRQVKATGVPDKRIYQQTFANGHTMWSEITAYPTLDGGLAAFFRDITEQKQLEQNLREADRRKDEFLAMLAHELRNPLAPISAAVKIMQMVQLDEARLKQTSQVIGRQVSHMTGLVDDLLDVSRVTRGLIELNNDAIDIQHVVNEAVEQASPLIRSRGQVLTIRLAPQKASVYGDKKRLVQVLANILNNAAKYTAEGGHLTLCTSVQDKKVLIEVTDDGIGMTLETAKHAFDLFAQAERSSDRSSGGLGLGLALVKSLVELHDGTVSCKSGGLGQGSTFSICLPRLVNQTQPASSAAGGNVAASTTASLKILVVDDNVDAAEMLKMLLEMIGHEVVVEHSPLRALQQAKFYKPQVCLVDIGLPEIDGNEVARRLRAHPENAGAVLVAVTGYGQESDRASALAAGFDHHLVKPIDTVALTSILSAISRK